MATFKWTSGAQKGGCPGPENYIAPGWYLASNYGPGITPLATSYKNPSTGLAYTPTELEALVGGGEVGATPTTTPTTPTGGYPTGGYPAVPSTPMVSAPTTTSVSPEYDTWLAERNRLKAEHEAKIGVTTLPTTTPTAPTPTFGAGAAAAIPTPEVKPAPAYEPSPELQAWEEKYGAKLTDWVKAEGYGIPKETQALMIQQQTDTLKAREQENIRIMRNNMERRGITNSGYIDANMHMITSNTSVAIAGAIADVQIKSALLKMASFEKAMGQAAQFLGFLSEQSQLAYAPKFATWQAEQIATMQKWQGQLDLLKIDINQAYQTQNIKLQAQLQSEYAEQQHEYDLELAEMEIETQQQAAAAEGAGNLIGGASGLVASIITK